MPQRRKSVIGFPLLAKELVEQAARPRTYFIRVGYALLVLGAAVVLFAQILENRSGNPLAALGQGRRMFQQLFMIQFIGVCLFMPAITSGVITREKERNSLASLLLTRLGPWTILFEKLLSRLIPMLTFLLLALPLMAFTYTLGGVTGVELWGSVWFLVLTAVQLGSIAIFCSAFCRSTVTAFISSYLIGMFSLLCTSSIATEPGNFQMEPSLIIGFTLFSGMTSGLSLIMARVVLVERAFVPPRNLMLEFFQSLDGFFTSLNQITGGVVLVRDDQLLPGDAPIAWRETQKKSLGTARYLFRVLSAIEVPLLFVLVAGSWEVGRRASVASTVLYLVWIVALLIVSVKATSVVSSERTSQTLSVLLTVPLSGRDILRQKFSGARRLQVVLLVPFFTIIGFVAWWEFDQGGLETEQTVRYLVAATVSVLVFFSLATWTAFLLGLMIRSQARAIMVTLGVVFAVVFVPVFLRPTPDSPDVLRSELWRNVVAYSPSGFVMANESRQLDWGTIVVAGLAYATLAAGVRWYSLFHADRWLERAEPQAEPPPKPAAVEQPVAVEQTMA